MMLVWCVCSLKIAWKLINLLCEVADDSTFAFNDIAFKWNYILLTIQFIKYEIMRMTKVSFPCQIKCIYTRLNSIFQLGLRSSLSLATSFGKFVKGKKTFMINLQTFIYWVFYLKEQFEINLGWCEDARDRIPT